jgi:Uma2 family endonuclease
MPPTASRRLTFSTVGEILSRLGGIDPNRVRMDPVPGSATPADVIRIQEREDRLYELVDGTLVEKVMGTPESFVAGVLFFHLRLFLGQADLGFALPPDGVLRMMPDLVRIPDVSFVSWDRCPTRRVPGEAVAGLVPDLAAEVLSPGNTPAEMDRKLRDYFFAGVRLVWVVDHRKRRVTVYTSPDDLVRVSADRYLDGRDVLPGFRLPVRTLFDRVTQEVTKPRKKKRR